uniref:ZM domain-containing protein n=1 Tax=Angiostrongylus cantonensis TaxID=6313 RepID=A0A0K0CT70_ANGCA
ACWQTQHRVPPDVQPPQIGKISIPEFKFSKKKYASIQRTVIVNKPSYQKVKWNEFPEEVVPEIGSAPKVHTQEWKPVNQEAVEIQRNQYRPSKISRVWPPPQEEVVKETKCPIRLSMFASNFFLHYSASGPQHMPSVQWPPAESEQHEREQVEVLQKHIPARKMEYQWPPPPPVYQGNLYTTYDRLSLPSQQQKPVRLQNNQCRIR